MVRLGNSWAGAALRGQLPAGLPGRGCARAQAPDLRRGQFSNLAAAQIVDSQRADPDAYQPLDGRTHRSEHPAQLALPALPERAPIPGQTTGRRDQELLQAARLGERCRPEAFDEGDPLLQLDALLQVTPLIHGQRRTHADGVLPVNAVAWVEHAIRPVAVIREEQET